MPDNNELDVLYDEYRNRVLTLNSSIWTTLITLHAIIISVFALTLSSLLKQTNCIIRIIIGVALFLSLLSIFLLFKNFVAHRAIYQKLFYHMHPNNRDYEKLKAESNNTQTINKMVRRNETFAEYFFYVEVIFLFVLLLFYVY